MGSNTKALTSLQASQAALQQDANWFDVMEVMAPELASALPVPAGQKDAVADRMRRSALNLIRGNPAIGNCTRESVLGGLLSIATLGLEIAPSPADQAYLVPFVPRIKVGGKWQDGKPVATMIVGYKGIIELARRSGEITDISSRCVYKGDEFRWEYGSNEGLHHSFDIFDDSAGDRSDEDIVGAYMVAHLASGRQHVNVMRRSELLKHRAASASAVDKYTKEVKDRGPWAEWFPAMCRKTTVRAEAPYLPMSAEVRQGMSIDERVASWTPEGENEMPTPEDRPEPAIEDVAPVAVLPAPSGSPAADDTEGEQLSLTSAPAAKDGDPAVPARYDEAELASRVGSWRNHLGKFTKDLLVEDYGGQVDGGKPAAKRMTKAELTLAIAELLAPGPDPVPETADMSDERPFA